MRDPKHLLARSVGVLTLLSLLAGCRHGGGEADRPAPMDPLRDELLASTGMSDEDSQLLRRADRCAGYDRFWIQGMQRDEQTETIYEFLGSSTACWRRVAETGLSHTGVQTWLEGWAGYVSVQRGYVWAQLAVEANNRFDACLRYEVAQEDLDSRRGVVARTSEGLSTPAARAMANRLQEVFGQIAASLDADRSRQRCDRD